jgi:hypothetical protein
MKRLIFAGIVTMLLAASSLVACGGGSCLDEFPCNAGDDDGLSDGSFDGTTKITVDASGDVDVADAQGDAIDDMSTIDDADVDAQADGNDASDD